MMIAMKIYLACENHLQSVKSLIYKPNFLEETNVIMCDILEENIIFYQIYWQNHIFKGGTLYPTPPLPKRISNNIIFTKICNPDHPGPSDILSENINLKFFLSACTWVNTMRSRLLHALTNYCDATDIYRPLIRPNNLIPLYIKNFWYWIPNAHSSLVVGSFVSRVYFNYCNIYHVPYIYIYIYCIKMSCP